MLDGAGKVRITDFGLAGIAAMIEGADIRAGTPAYMAPEQLGGMEVTVKSDIYSLGLILYEIITGKRAFDATTLPELMRMREESRIPNPSTIVRDIDPLFERVILRCLATRSGVASGVGAAGFRGAAGRRSARSCAGGGRNTIAADGCGCRRKRRNRAARGAHIFGSNACRNSAAVLLRHKRKRALSACIPADRPKCFRIGFGTHRQDRISGATC